MAKKSSKADELEERLIDFAVRIVKLSGKLKKDESARYMAQQMLRSGTSPAANYAEARAGESNADFIHKLSIVLKELNETLTWMKIIERSGLVKPHLLKSLVQENDELCKIIASSRNTAHSRKTKRKSRS